MIEDEVLEAQYRRLGAVNVCVNWVRVFRVACYNDKSGQESDNLCPVVRQPSNWTEAVGRELRFLACGLANTLFLEAVRIFTVSAFASDSAARLEATPYHGSSNTANPTRRFDLTLCVTPGTLFRWVHGPTHVDVSIEFKNELDKHWRVDFRPLLESVDG